MPRRSPHNEKSPPKLGSNQAGKKKVGSLSVAPPPADRKIQPPRDPVLRAIWRVCSEDLSNQERLGLLILWRLLGEDEKPLGASLFAKLLNTSYARAKNILTKLQRLKYITSDGQFSAGLSKRATRAMTKKAKLPAGKTRHRAVTGSGHHDPAPLGASDLGVRPRGRCGSDDPPAGESGGKDDHPHEERTVRIIDLLADDAESRERQRDPPSAPPSPSSAS